MIFARLAFSLLLIAVALHAGARKTENIVLVTTDGLRWQEVFRGIDPGLMEEEAAGMKEGGALRQKLWADAPEQRRRALMPFFWNVIAPGGVALGNRDKGSAIEVSNGIRISYPGYSEILTGRAQDDVIHSNDKVQNPATTVLEVLKSQWKLGKSQVALFASWEVFQYIGEHEPGSIFINAGYRGLPPQGVTPRMQGLSAMQFELLTPWDSVRHDYFTFEMALEYLRTSNPRVLYIALGETDDWAHERRYDRVLQTASYVDRCLAALWMALQNSPHYRGKTSLIVTTDHGRGRTLDDWHSHGAKVAGAEEIWLAVAGPDTPARGDLADTPLFEQRDIAPTILDLAGIDYHEMPGVEGKPIPLVFDGQPAGARN